MVPGTVKRKLDNHIWYEFSTNEALPNDTKVDNFVTWTMT